LVETFAEYKDEIIKIDFKVNVDKLRTDIGQETKRILD
jgi:hypothetical protein